MIESMNDTTNEVFAESFYRIGLKGNQKQQLVNETRRQGFAIYILTHIYIVLLSLLLEITI